MRKSRKLFIVPTGRVVAKPTVVRDQPDRNYKYEKKAGRKVGGRKYTGGRTQDGTKTRTEMQKMLDRMRTKDSEIKTILESEPMKINHTNTHKTLADRVDEDLKWGKRGINTVGYIDAPNTDDSGATHTYHESVEKGTKALNEMGQSRVSHKIRVTTGRPTTRAIWNVVKSNGLTREVLYDTKFPIGLLEQWEVGYPQRDHTSGFNSKQVTVLSPSTWVTTRDLLSVTSSATESNISGSRQTAYASILDATTEMLIHNQSRFHKMKVKIHLVKIQTEPALTIDTVVGDIISKVVNASPTIQEGCAVPLVYQHSTPLITESTVEALQRESNMVSTAMSLKSRGLEESAHFRDRYKIVKTSGITLLAGEVLKYRHTHCFGPGFDMSKTCDTDGVEARLLDPLSYFYIIEQVGAEIIEGTYTYETNRYTSVLGANPTYLALEVRKSMRYANDATSADDLATGGVPRKEVHMRVWQSDPQRDANDTQKEFFVLPQDISPLAPAPVGQMNIFTTTDLNVQSNIHGSRVNN